MTFDITMTGFVFTTTLPSLISCSTSRQTSKQKRMTPCLPAKCHTSYGGFVAVQLMPLRCVCPLLSGFGLEGVEFGEVAGEVVGGEGVVLEVAGEEFVVGGHVYQAMA